MERMELVSAIYDSGLDEHLGFSVSSVHEYPFDIIGRRGAWKVVLKPNRGRIYFIYKIAALIDTLDIDVGICTDFNFPGCIVIN